MDKNSSLNITRIDDSFIGKFVECTVKNTEIKEAYIIKQGNDYFLLQDHMNGSAPRNMDWRSYGYKHSWTLNKGTDLTEYNVYTVIHKILSPHKIPKGIVKSLFKINST